MALGTLAAQLNVGTRGRIFITDDGHTIRFYVGCTDPATNTDYRWDGSIGGVGVGSGNGYVRLNAGFGERLLWEGPVTNSMRVQFSQRATGTQGLGGASGVVYYDVNRTTVPNAPLVSGVNQGNILGASEVTLDGFMFKFQDNGNGGLPILEWQIAQATNAAYTENRIDVSSSGTTRFTGKKKSTTYYNAARGRNANGWGAYGFAAPVTTLGTIGDPPPAPVVQALTATTVTVRIDNPSYLGPAPYKRVVEVLAVLTDTVVKTVTEPTQDYVFTGLTRGTPYRLRQRIDNAIGTGPWSAITTFTTNGAPPSAPTGYGPFDVASTSAFTTPGVLADNGGQVPVDMRVQYNTSATDVGATTVTQGFWGNASMTGLARGVQYYYRIAAFNSLTGGGWGPYGAWVPFITKLNVPSAPQGLNVSSITDVSALIQWTAPAETWGSEIVSYVLRVAENKAMVQNLKTFTLPPTELNQALGSLKKGTLHFVTIHTISSNGIGSITPVLSFLTLGTGPTLYQQWKRINGVWRRGIKWKRINGVWRRGIKWKRINGVWRRQ